MPGASLDADDRHAGPEATPRRRSSGRWSQIGLKRGVVIVMNPQTGEVLALVSLPTYDNNLFARGHLAPRTSRRCSRTRTSRCSTTRSRRTTRRARPTSSSTGTGGLADGKITPTTRVQTQGLPDARRRPGSTTGTAAAGAAATSTAASATRATRSSSRSPGCSASTGSATGRNQYGFGEPTGIDLPGEVVGHRPDQRSGSRTPSAQPIFPGETYQAGIGQGYDVVTPDPADQRLRGAGQRRQALPAADRARGRRARRHGRPAVRARAHPQARRRARACCATMRKRRARRRHPPPHLQPRRPADQGRRQVRHRRVRARATAKGRLPFHSWFVGLRAQEPVQRRDFDEAPTRSWSSWPSPTTRGPRATPATEIVKYFLQLHFDIKKDYRNRDLLERGNFYQSN